MLTPDLAKNLQAIVDGKLTDVTACRAVIKQGEAELSQLDEATCNARTLVWEAKAKFIAGPAV